MRFGDGLNHTDVICNGDNDLAYVETDVPSVLAHLKMRCAKMPL